MLQENEPMEDPPDYSGVDGESKPEQEEIQIPASIQSELTEVPEQSEPSPRPPHQSYNPAHSLFFKTTDRILDDIRNDPYFLKESSKLLNQPSVRYAQKLSSFILGSSSSSKYQLVTLRSSLEYLNMESVKELKKKGTTTATLLRTFHGIIVPKSTAKLVPKDPLYHFTLKIKGPLNESQLKHKFYAFDNTQLAPGDREDLILDEALIRDQVGHYSNQLEEYLAKVITQSLPHIVDSVNLVSERTNTIVRVEVYDPVLTYNELKDFEDVEIQSRVATYLSKITDKFVVDNLRVKVPTTLECLNTLFRVLKGPFDNIDVVYRKTLKPDASPVLRLHLDLDLLITKFFFRKVGEEPNLELEPPHFKDFNDLEHVCSDYYARALQEVLYVSSLFAEDPRSFFKLATVDFDSSLKEIFEAFNENDLQQQLQHWQKWSAFQYNSGFTTLSSCSFYSDSLIIESYNRMVSLDPSRIPAYFDALAFCATSKGGQELQIYATTLRSQGMLGFDEMKACFQRLGFELKTVKDMINLNDDEVILSYKNHVVVSETKSEKAAYRQALEKIAKYRSSDSIRIFLNTEPMFDVSDAYCALETSPAVDDDVLITAYQLKAEDSNFHDATYARALVTIAINRKSMMLMNFIDDNIPDFFGNSEVTLENAFQIVGADEYASDTALIRIFQERVNKETKINFHEIWQALKIIGDSHKSKLIEGFLTSGIVDSALLSVDKAPTGLNNIGNTCYLNSLLQYYFVVKPLRELVLNFDKVLTSEVFETSPQYKIRRIGGRVVGYKETERSYQFMYQLKDLYYRMIHDNQRCVSPTRELAYLAFSPIGDEVEFEYGEEEDEVMEIEKPADGETFTVTNSEDLVDFDEEDEKDADGGSTDIDNEGDIDIPDAHSEHSSDEFDPLEVLASVAEQPKTLPRTNSIAVAKIGHDQIENAFEIGRQQDVTECISNVLSQIESALDPDMLDEDNEQLDFVKKLFYGKTKQTLIPVDVHTKEEKPVGKPRSKIERFLNLIVNIGDHPKDIYDALDTYFTEDLLQLDNEEVKRSLTITELPDILQIQIQRVQFDRVRLIPVKSTEPIPFEEKLYMDRYMDTDDETVIAKRKEVFHWRRRIEELNRRRSALTLTNQHGLTAREALEATKQFLRSDTMNQVGVLVDENTLDVLENQIKKIDEELNGLKLEVQDLQAKISHQFDGFNKIGYSNFAIFIHRGQASYGHYWIYIRDPKTGMYRKYNDEVVSEVTIDEVLNFSDSNTATPYYLAFVKSELIDSIEPLKREIVATLVEEID
ncbi:DEKNAAC101529 [Brettanomyces naardenensis]|uniref:Ubiquitin carboxyl-terminal hydrolase 2 n=1 Tax=Brettanomyces naardenensis TaxID=13370 RepID=A0A448YIF4_BRENA|nr:DEKNAAC101529 [Brettanomyces naardenensis]